ncbi:MAG: PIN domain-containing protein [Thermoleophilia bacterium]|nr:PIN domain-containing protein [Thermoleophilia bacterium]
MALILADASILIATLDGDDPLHAAAVAALAAAWTEGEEVVVPVVAYAEAMVRPVAIGGPTAEAAEAFFASLRVLPLSRGAAAEAARLRAAHRALRLPDALILGAAIDAGGEAMTADASWPRYSPAVRLVSG